MRLRGWPAAARCHQGRVLAGSCHTTPRCGFVHSQVQVSCSDSRGRSHPRDKQSRGTASKTGMFSLECYNLSQKPPEDFHSRLIGRGEPCSRLNQSLQMTSPSTERKRQGGLGLCHNQGVSEAAKGS